MQQYPPRIRNPSARLRNSPDPPRKSRISNASSYPPFPPPNVVLHPDDANSKVFLAIARSFLSVDNRAMTIKDLAEMTVNYGLVCQNISAASQAITTYIRLHMQRCDTQQDHPLLLRHVLSGTPSDDDLLPALHSRSGGAHCSSVAINNNNHHNQPGETRMTNFRKGTMVWYLSRATGAPCPFARAGIRLCDYGDAKGSHGSDSKRKREKRAAEQQLQQYHDDEICGQKRKRPHRECRGDEGGKDEVDARPPKVKLTLRLRPPFTSASSVGASLITSATTLTPPDTTASDEVRAPHIIDLSHDSDDDSDDSDSDSDRESRSRSSSSMDVDSSDDEEFADNTADDTQTQRVPASIPNTNAVPSASQSALAEEKPWSLPPYPRRSSTVVIPSYTPSYDASSSSYPLQYSSGSKDVIKEESGYRRSPSVASPPPDSEGEDDDYHIAMTMGSRWYDDTTTGGPLLWDDEEERSEGEGETAWDSPGPRSPSASGLVQGSVGDGREVKLEEAEEPRGLPGILEAWDDTNLGVNPRKEPLLFETDTIGVKLEDSWEWEWDTVGGVLGRDLGLGMEREWYLPFHDDIGVTIKQEDVEGELLSLPVSNNLATLSTSPSTSSSSSSSSSLSSSQPQLERINQPTAGSSAPPLSPVTSLTAQFGNFFTSPPSSFSTSSSVNPPQDARNQATAHDTRNFLSKAPRSDTEGDWSDSAMATLKQKNALTSVTTTIGPRPSLASLVQAMTVGGEPIPSSTSTAAAITPTAAKVGGYESFAAASAVVDAPYAQQQQQRIVQQPACISPHQTRWDFSKNSATSLTNKVKGDERVSLGQWQWQWNHQWPEATTEQERKERQWEKESEVVVHTCEPCVPPICATQLEGISVYQMRLGAFTLLRRIDTDFVNLSPIAAYAHTSSPLLPLGGTSSSSATGIPGAEVVEMGSPGVLGLWVPLKEAQRYVKEYVTPPVATVAAAAAGLRATRPREKASTSMVVAKEEEEGESVGDGEDPLSVFLSDVLFERFPMALREFCRGSTRPLGKFGPQFASTIHVAGELGVVVRDVTSPHGVIGNGKPTLTLPMVSPTSTAVSPNSAVSASNYARFASPIEMGLAASIGRAHEMARQHSAGGATSSPPPPPPSSRPPEDESLLLPLLLDQEEETPLSATEQEIFQSICIIPSESPLTSPSCSTKDDGMELDSPEPPSREFVNPSVAMTVSPLGSMEPQAKKQEKPLRRSRRVADAKAAARPTTATTASRTRGGVRRGSRNSLS